MNIGSLYTVKNLFWLLHPTKEIAALGPPMYSAAAPAAAYWSKQFNCDVTYFSPDSIVVFLEEDGKLKRVLTSDGRVGWTWFDESYNDCFEEVSS